MTSGSHNMRKWEIKFDNKQRWDNPLMGWASSGKFTLNIIFDCSGYSYGAGWPGHAPEIYKRDRNTERLSLWIRGNLYSEAKN